MKMCLSACCARDIGNWLKNFYKKELNENVADREDTYGSSLGLVPVVFRVAALTK